MPNIMQFLITVENCIILPEMEKAASGQQMNTLELILYLYQSRMLQMMKYVKIINHLNESLHCYFSGSNYLSCICFAI